MRICLNINEMLTGAKRSMTGAFHECALVALSASGMSIFAPDPGFIQNHQHYFVFCSAILFFSRRTVQNKTPDWVIHRLQVLAHAGVDEQGKFVHPIFLRTRCFRFRLPTLLQ